MYDYTIYFFKNHILESIVNFVRYKFETQFVMYFIALILFIKPIERGNYFGFYNTAPKKNKILSNSPVSSKLADFSSETSCYSDSSPPASAGCTKTSSSFDQLISSGSYHANLYKQGTYEINSAEKISQYFKF